MLLCSKDHYSGYELLAPSMCAGNNVDPQDWQYAALKLETSPSQANLIYSDKQVPMVERPFWDAGTRLP